MKLTHVGIRFFRSIGPDPATIDLSRKITILVGQNDSGKSNVLRGLDILSNACRDGTLKDLKEIDFFQRKRDQRPIFRLTADPTDDDIPFIKELGTTNFEWQLGKNWQEAEWPQLEAMEVAEHNIVKQHIHGTHFSGYPPKDHLISSSRSIAGQICAKIKSGFPDFYIIPQFRRIEDTSEYSIDGKGIIKMLASWQVPSIGKEDLKHKFQRIENLLRELLNRPSAGLEVPFSHNEILVRDGDMRLPLESHGTGVHQLIVLAIAVLSKDNVYFGIEEPEIHLHPLLQRRFLDFLRKETKNRYVITTHSPALISPSDEVAVTHVRMNDGTTFAENIDTDSATLSALHDLGIRPSDLLQANCVIWVEGPSDRIYLNRWLTLVEPNLREGVDYSIMFYGGRLLSHLSLEQGEANESEKLVRVLRINQHSVIVMDSDKKDESDDISQTKKRIERESQEGGLLCWITDGREIENYLSDRVVSVAWGSEVGNAGTVKLKKFEKIQTSIKRAFAGANWKSSWQYEEHKPEWSRRLAARLLPEDIGSDLQGRLEKLVKFIRNRN